MPVSNEDADYTRDELSRFRKIVKQFRAEVPGDYKAHVLQSAGLLAFNDPTFEIVRAGIMLYGISPLPEFQKLLKPVMTWKTRIALVRDMPKGSSISYGRTFITPRRMRVATLVGRLCRWLSAASFQSRRGGAGSRKKMCAAWSRDHGPHHDRCFRH